MTTISSINTYNNSYKSQPPRVKNSQAQNLAFKGLYKDVFKGIKTSLKDENPSLAILRNITRAVHKNIKVTTQKITLPRRGSNVAAELNLEKGQKKSWLWNTVSETYIIKDGDKELGMMALKRKFKDRKNKGITVGTLDTIQGNKDYRKLDISLLQIAFERAIATSKKPKIKGTAAPIDISLSNKHPAFYYKKYGAKSIPQKSVFKPNCEFSDLNKVKEKIQSMERKNDFILPETPQAVKEFKEFHGWG